MLNVVSEELLAKEAIEPEKPKAAPSSNGYHHTVNGRRLNVERWLSDNGRAFEKKPGRDDKGREIYILETCPFNPEHGKDACVMQDAEGATAAHCFHNGCSGRGWQDFKREIGNPRTEHYEGGTERKHTPSSNGKAHEETARTAETTDQKTVQLTDRGNAIRLARKYGKIIRYCHLTGKWYIWNGKVWAEDQTGQIMAFAKSITDELFDWAKRQLEELKLLAQDGDEEAKNKLAAINAVLAHAIKMQHVQRLKAMVDLAKSEPGIAVVPEQLDANPWHLNCQNGIVDLKTARLLPHDPKAYCTKICPVSYNPDAECPKWNKCLSEVMNSNLGLVDYLARAMGYSTTGIQKEQALFFNYGIGCNGKSLVLGEVQYVMGDYACTGYTGLMTIKHGESHPTEIAALFGRRFVVLSETEDGKRMAESLVKQLTGTEMITARKMRQDFFDFWPSHHLWIAGNHRPRICGTDDGIWRRIRMVPFTVSFKGREDKNLATTLRGEAEGILAWLVRGCLEWQRIGLNEPPEVTSAVEEYRGEQDRLAAWIEESCYVGPQAQRRASELYANYKSWAEKGGEYVVSLTAFGNELNRRGFEKFTNNGVWRRGIDLKSA